MTGKVIWRPSVNSRAWLPWIKNQGRRDRHDQELSLQKSVNLSFNLSLRTSFVKQSKMVECQKWWRLQNAVVTREAEGVRCLGTSHAADVQKV